MTAPTDPRQDPRSAAPGFGAMVADTKHLPNVLPTDRLLAKGKPVPELRASLRDIPDWRSWLAVTMVCVEPVLVIWAAIWLSHPLA